MAARMKLFSPVWFPTPHLRCCHVQGLLLLLNIINIRPPPPLRSNTDKNGPWFWLRASVAIWNILKCLSQEQYFIYDPFPCNASLQSAHHCPYLVNVSHNFFLSPDLKVLVHALSTFLIGEFGFVLFGLNQNLDVQLMWRPWHPNFSIKIVCFFEIGSVCLTKAPR